jgi:uncharacterized protein (DUF4415 family)
MRFEWDDAKQVQPENPWTRLCRCRARIQRTYYVVRGPIVFATRSSVSSLSAYSAASRSPSSTPNRQISSGSFLFGGQHTMKQHSSSRQSRTISRRRRTSPKPVKVTAEHPELDPKHVVRVIVRNGLKPVLPKTTISLRVDADVLEWFKAAGPGYQTRINAVLRAYKEASV